MAPRVWLTRKGNERKWGVRPNQGGQKWGEMSERRSIGFHSTRFLFCNPTRQKQWFPMLYLAKFWQIMLRHYLGNTPWPFLYQFHQKIGEIKLGFRKKRNGGCGGFHGGDLLIPKLTPSIITTNLLPITSWTKPSSGWGVRVCFEVESRTPNSGVSADQGSFQAFLSRMGL